ncbi:hypothetical protein [Falsiroseomonas sp.]|uniref:hypothetical protein n=1 Tax=Falsiroseomonas sp. TaxID=2870721 RepID=UPI00273633CE|nr:hypothetical protein [Falsiroseomonas sp.]MDP3417882.1 hypothetical protein [Falsiroseomonas sp.]
MPTTRPQPALPATSAPPGYGPPEPLTLTRAGRLCLDLSSAAADLIEAWDTPHRDHAALAAALVAPMGRLRAAQRRAGAA